MTAIHLLRHGEADYEPIRVRNWPGAASDLAPLTSRGIRQASAAAAALGGIGAGLVVSSPMTRALQTAAIVASGLRLPLVVEFDLREWLPDDTFRWTTFEEVLAAGRDLEHCNGEWPDGAPRPWEPLSSVRRRSLAVLHRHAAGTRAGPVIAVTHGMVIQSLTGYDHTEPGGMRVLGIP